MTPRLVPFFIPSLVSILLRTEKERGSALTEAEVIAIRDRSVAVMLPIEQLPAMIEQRGYEDIDPEEVWSQWQQARLALRED